MGRQECLPHRHRPSHRGFFIYEMIIGMGILAVAALVLFVATTRTHLASSHFADARAATRAAEAALVNLQAGLPPGEVDKDTQVEVAPIASASALAPPKGWHWVDITATVRGQTRTLTGLVPEQVPHTAPAEGGAR